MPALYAAAILTTFRHYGITWDEGIFARFGELTLTQGPRASELHPDLRYYGPLFEALAAAFARLLPFDSFESRHLLIAFTGLGTVIAAGRFCKRAGAEPMIGQLALVLMPQFYGHAFNNSKDIPMACALAWMMFAFVCVPDDPRPRDAILPGIALGIAMAIRPGSLLLLVIPVVAAVVTRRWRMLIAGAIAVPIAWLVMVALWPAAWISPIVRPLASIFFAARIPTVYLVLFEGRAIFSNQLPVRYLPEMLAITLPIGTLVLALVGVVVVTRDRSFPRVLAATWVIVPLILFMIERPNVYDGIRHFLFVMPAIAILVAIAMTLVPRYALLMLLFPLLSMIRLHPYESAYYNELVGGTRGASARFETDYWASSYREAARWVRAHPCAGRPTRVLVAATGFSRECFIHELPVGEFAGSIMLTPGQRGAVPFPFDYYVATTRFALAGNFPASPIVYAVERDGAVFTVIRGGCR